MLRLAVAISDKVFTWHNRSSAMILFSTRVAMACYVLAVVTRTGNRLASTYDDFCPNVEAAGQADPTRFADRKEIHIALTDRPFEAHPAATGQSSCEDELLPVGWLRAEHVISPIARRS